MSRVSSPRRSRSFACFLLPLLTATAGAQTGWTQWTTGSGANNHWYLAVYVPGGINWADARTAAQALGGDLATITSAAENTFVFQRIANPIFWRVVANPTRIFGPWLGGVQPPGSPEPLGGWSWVTGEAWGYTRWANGEPNNYQGLPEDRVHFFVTGTTPADRWNDIRASTLVPGFVVEAASPPVAAYLPLGSGCAPVGSTPPTLLPAVAGVDVPRIGSTSFLRVGTLPASAGLVIVVMGLSNRYVGTSSGPVPLPLDLGGVGFAGCDLLVAPDVAFGHVPMATFVDHAVPIPAVAALLGTGFFCQALVLPGSSLTASVAAYVGL